MPIKSFCFFFCTAILSAGLVFLFVYGRNRNDKAQTIKQLGTNNSVSFLPEETAIEIARRSFAESPDATNPSPIVKREDSKTVVKPF